MHTETLGALVVAVGIGTTAGIAGYRFVYARGASYLTDDPAACANCHVMRYVTYRLADTEVSTFFLDLRRLAEARLAEVEQITRQYLEARGALESVGSNELLRRVRSGEVTILDVRPREEYRAGHIPRAVSVPLSELKKRLAEVPKGREVVAYCRGPYCVMAIEAVELLRERGFQAYRMEQGVADWRARGWHAEISEEPRREVRR